MKLGLKIDCHHPAPLFQAGQIDAAVIHDAGVIDKHIDPAVLASDLLNGACNIGQ